MKYIIITDTHIGYKSGSDDYHEIAATLFNRVVSYAKEYNISYMIHGGDFFDSRKSISVKSIPVSYDIMDSLSDAFKKIYLITGNHDTYYKNRLEPTSLDMFKKYTNVNIIKESVKIGDIHLQPWLIDDFVPMDAKYCIGHFEINGVPINRSGTEYNKGLSTSLFKNYDKVLSGHFHTKSKTNNIIYLGSPYHMTFNDDGDRGFYVFDDENGDLEFIEFTEYPKFIIFKHDKINYDIIEGNNIKIIFTEDIGNTKINNLNNKILDKKPNQLFVNFDFNESFSDDVNDNDIIDIIDIRTVEKKYLDNADIPDYIKRDRVDEHMNELWDKINE